MKRIVVFGTSDIQTLERNESNDGGYTLKSTGNLERALSLGFTVYVLSTRHKLGDSDKWWFDQAHFVYLATTPMDDSCSSCPGLIAPWLKLYSELGIPVPVKHRYADEEEYLQDELEGPLPQLRGFHSWLEAREGLHHVNIPDTILVNSDGFRHYP